jgi:hypothetical protein
MRRRRDRPFKQLADHALADAWVSAFNVMAKDYSRGEARATLDTLADEIRLRGLAPPMDRVAREMVNLAARMRADNTKNAPLPIERIRRGLEDELMEFAEEHNARGRQADKVQSDLSD